MKPQRFLAAAGYGSRRVCEKLIMEGRVMFNGAPMQFNADVSVGDEVRVDGKVVPPIDEKVFFAMNKPAGYISDRGVPNEKSALDLIHVPQRLFAVGRLDKDATGLLLLTNDGETAYRLTHPSYEHEKEYRVLVRGCPGESALDQWRNGVWLNGELTAPAQVKIDNSFSRHVEGADGQDSVKDAVNPRKGDTWLRVVLHEGRKRQIKRVAKLLGYPVIYLIRIRIGFVELGDLQPGQWRQLTPQEVRVLGKTSGPSDG